MARFGVAGQGWVRHGMAGHSFTKAQDRIERHAENILNNPITAKITEQ